MKWSSVRPGQWSNAHRRAALPIALLVGLATLPLLDLEPNVMRLLFITYVWVTASVAWNWLGGFAGQVSFGFAVFYGLGAYTTALTVNAGHNPLIAFIGSAVVAAIASLLIGLPTLRLKGPYFAIATIGISEAVRVVMTNLGFTGGASGYRIVERHAFHAAEHYYSALILAALAVAVSYAVASSKLGLGLAAIRQDEDAASDIGVNAYRYKLLTHALAAAFTGVAGGVFARYALFIHPQGVFGFQTSVQILLMPVIGGIGTIWGPVIGGAVFGIIEEEIVAEFPQIHLLIYGLLLIGIMLFEPGGILGGARKLYGRWRGIQKRKRAHSESRKADKVLWRTRGSEGREL